MVALGDDVVLVPVFFLVVAGLDKLIDILLENGSFVFHFESECLDY